MCLAKNKFKVIHRQSRLSPNEKCFLYLSARKLGKDLSMNLLLYFQQFDLIILFCFIQYTDNYKIVEEKANRAKLTSDLSTNESSQENDVKNKH